MIRAETHSDDRRIEIAFDATAWFEQATDAEIVALADAGWGGDYEADAVAEHFEQTATKGLFDYLAIAQPMPNGDTVGFECHVEEDQALAWLKAVRPSLHATLDPVEG
jgi:hypothetical protein